ncbi:hypothetical protein L0F63_006885 [Massospora cicadina]|nr:hypothetical protein L0F63_006885 [Massospora cicadina]
MDANISKCKEIRTRRNIRTLSTIEVTRYFEAVKKLNSGPKPTRYDWYMQLHQQMFNLVHNNQLFLAWHRLLLFKVEKELHILDDSVMIPYWDWSQSAQTPRSDPALSSRMFGMSGNARTSCVDDGAFSNFTVYYWSSGRQGPHCLRRSRNIFQRPFTTAPVLDQNYLNIEDISRFSSALEWVPHGIAHNNIGGEFSTSASAGDPLFYSHHAFVDKLWFDWQNRHRSKYFDYGINKNMNIMPWSVPITQVLDPNSMCYRYPQERFSYFKNPQRGRAPNFIPEKYVPPINATHAELMAHARRYILKGLGPAIEALHLIIPEPLPVSFIRRMKYNLAKVREQERMDALLMAFLD